MDQSTVDNTQPKKLDANKLVELLRQLFVVPDTLEELLTIGGLTDRQKEAILLLAQGKGIEEITLQLAPQGGGLSDDGKKVYTYNTYDALNGAINKFIRALSLVAALQQDYKKTLVSAIFNRAQVVGKKKTGTDRFVLPMINLVETQA